MQYKPRVLQSSKNSSDPGMLSLHWIHWLIIALSTFVTFAVWNTTNSQIEEKSELKFKKESDQVVSLIEERLAHYEDALWSGAAYIAAIDYKLDASKWKKYSDNLNIHDRYRGINGIGVIYAIPYKGKTNLVERERAQRPDFNVFPEHSRDVSLPIVYVEPESTNRAAIGLDVAHEQNRYSAAQAAAETGLARITKPIVLVQDNEKTPGFLFYVPMYSSSSSSNLDGWVSKPIFGYVYAPFIFSNLMDGILSQDNRQVNIRLTDSGQVLFDEIGASEEATSPAAHSLSVTTNTYGRKWVLEIESADRFGGSAANSEPTMILFTGLLIDALLFFVFYTLVRSNQNAVSYAEMITKDIQEAKQEYEKIAHYDYLTGLPNRYSFMCKLQDVIDSSRDQSVNFSVCFMDLDNFKVINDTLGHPVGDKLLTVFVGLVQPKLRSSDYFARLGGDEFGLIIQDYDTMIDVQKLLTVCINIFKKPVTVNTYKVHTGISVGVAEYPLCGNTADELLGSADIAMYRVKAKGKNAIGFYDEDMNQEVKKRHTIDQAIRSSINNDELSVVYQPQVDIETNAIIGVEALLRWKSKELGNVPPTDFIEISEENGYILEIGKWLINKTFSDFARLKKETGLPELTLSINISARELETSNLLHNTVAALAAERIDPSDIYLELTESSLMKNIENTRKVMLDLKSTGVKFSLDDFGTGYSSMQYLKTFPISKLKIDKVFVQDITTDKDDAIIVRATINLARGLGMEVIAEGVETKEQIEYLQENGCYEIQGYYYSRPLSYNDMVLWCKKFGSKP